MHYTSPGIATFGGIAVPLYHLVALAIVQGITEFLPISSSGHLVLTSRLAGWPDQGLTIDIAVHAGTLVAVIAYFYADVWRLVAGSARLLTGRLTTDGRLALLILVATLPIVAAGYFLSTYVATLFRNVELIAWTTIGFGLLLGLIDRISMTFQRTEHLSFGNAAFIGVAQILALLPGTSRSGITITAGRLLNMERREAARFSMLLSIPTILGAATLAGRDLYATGNIALGYDAALVAGLSFVTALIAISAMMRWLQRASYWPFVAYRLLLGVFLLYWVYA